MKKEYAPIYSMQLCNALLKAGCQIDHVDVNRRDGSSIVFYFVKDETVTAYTDYYTLSKRLQMLKENIKDATEKF